MSSTNPDSPGWAPRRLQTGKSYHSLDTGKRLDDGWVREAGGLATMDEKV